jgi:hypothetical protein
VPLASWQHAIGKNVTGLLSPFGGVLVAIMNQASQTDDLALDEESPSLWSQMYRTDVNVYATGRQSSHGTPCATTSTNRPLTFVTIVDCLNTLGST